MKKIFFLFSAILLFNGCINSVALLGSSAGSASSGKLLQSTLQSSLSYGIKKQTGKTPLGHALAYADKVNPEKKKETCISFIEKTRSEFCSIAKKQISLTNKAIKEKVVSAVKINSETKNSFSADVAIKAENNVALKDLDTDYSFNKIKQTPRELAIIFQNQMKNMKDKLLKQYLVSR